MGVGGTALLCLLLACDRRPEQTQVTVTDFHPSELLFPYLYKTNPTSLKALLTVRSKQNTKILIFSTSVFFQPTSSACCDRFPQAEGT